MNPGVSAPQGEALPEPLLSMSATLPIRIRIFLRTWAMKVITKFYFEHMAWRNPLPRDQWPTLTKRYLDVPDLAPESRVFIPKTYKSGDKPLPLLIDVHGGGFMVGHPVTDDRNNAQFCYRHGFVVVSIPYRLSPWHQFPQHTHDVAAQIRAVIDDESLPIDRSKIAIMGYSAGGNLALSACQLDGLHKEIKAAIGFYPSVDFATSSETKVKTRVPDGKEDVVFPLAQTFYYGYVPGGTNLRDPLLSPLYAQRDKLPQKMYITGCEHDMLCDEALRIAEKHAEGPPGERKVTANGAGWQQGDVRWELIKGEPHGFDQMPERDVVVQKRRRDRVEQLVADVADWLQKDVFV